MPAQTLPRWVKPVAVVVVSGAVAVAAIASTTFVPVDADGGSSSSVASGLQQNADFDPAATAAELFPQIVAGIPDATVDIVDLHNGVQADEAAFGAEFGQDLGAGSFVVPVRIEGTVSEVDDAFIYFDVEGIDGENQAVVPIAGALNGGPVRDSLGLIRFGDVPDQIAFQTLAQEIKNLMVAEVVDPIDPPSLVGKDIVVIGAWKNGLLTPQYIVQPVIIEVPS